MVVGLVKVASEMSGTVSGRVGPSPALPPVAAVPAVPPLAVLPPAPPPPFVLASSESLPHAAASAIALTVVATAKNRWIESMLPSLRQTGARSPMRRTKVPPGHFVLWGYVPTRQDS